jgi:hypothetical protein
MWTELAGDAGGAMIASIAVYVAHGYEARKTAADLR